MSTKVYLINLDRDSDKLTAMSEQMARLSISFERVEAIDGTQLPRWLIPYFLDSCGEVASELRPGEVGCYASHLMIMARVASGGSPALVLEDDLEIASDVPEILASQHKLPKGWDVLRLSGQNRRAKFSVGPLCDGRSVVKYSRIPFGTGAYLITPEGARKFSNWKTLRIAPIDQDMRRVWDCGLATYGVEPIPIRQDVVPSTIKLMGGAQSGRKYSNRHSFVDAVDRVAHDVRWLGPHNWIRAQIRL